MISIVLYGRNDNYGYNLHKRAALSFNCMAEVLHDEDDEILFVDYNTPDDFPTFPEAIQDTLSEKARKRLRVLRVRPHVHRRFSAKTRLVALEPISRNVAVRRSNPANRWILSTNTDMIFVPRRARSLNEIARDLPAGFYHAPRIEIPETLWEGLDRNNARETIETVRELGSALHINEIVFGSPLILYDGPGDFQLMQRSDLFDIHGFDEEMLLGWHVDSNIAKRLTMLRGKVGDLGKEVYGYHCDHARQVTLMHSHSRTENDWRRFIDDVPRPELPEQAKSWGCADDEIEEIRLTGQGASAYVKALRKQIGERQSAPPVVAYVGENYNKTDYDPRHVLPYLADMFVCCERRTNVAWFGARGGLLARFAGFWKELGFTGDILVDGSLVREAGLATTAEAVEASFDTLLGKADAFVFDFAPVPESEDAFGGIPRVSANAMNKALLRVVGAEHHAMRDGKPLRRIIAVNAINNVFEAAVTSHIGAAHTPFSARMRNGFVLPSMTGEVDWTSRLQAGQAGIRDGSLIKSRKEMLGPVIQGPHRHLHAGTYRFKLWVSGSNWSGHDEDRPIAVLEIVSRREYLGHRLISPSDLAKGEIELDVDVTTDQSLSPGFSIETRFRTLAPVEVTISALSCERISDVKTTKTTEALALSVNEWLPLLWTGPEARRKNGYIFHGSAKPGIVFFGPYWRLPEGNYEAVFKLEAEAAGWTLGALIRGYAKALRPALGALWRRVRGIPIGAHDGRYPLCTFQAISQNTELASKILFVGNWRSKKEVTIPFTVPPSLSADPDFGLEFRLLAHSQLPFGFKGVTVRRTAA
jgi:hypothetical protein